MINNLSGPAKATIFYAIALGLAVGLAVFVSGTVGEATAMLTMVTPAVSLLVMMLVITGEGRSRAGWISLGVTRAGLRGWWLAILGPMIILATSYALAYHELNTPKLVWALGAWLAVSVIALGRVAGGWQARRAAIYSSVSFAAVVALYVAFRVAETNGGGRFL